MANTRTRIVTATAELFRSQGFNGTSIKQVVDAAHAPNGSVYHFFPGGKEELAATVIRETGAAYLALFEMIASDHDGIADGVRAFFDGAADALEEGDYVDVCPIGSIAREVASTHEPLRKATVDVFEGWNDGIQTRLRAEGLPPEEARTLADTIVAALEGGFVLARARRATAALRTTGAHMRQLVVNALADA